MKHYVRKTIFTKHSPKHENTVDVDYTRAKRVGKDFETNTWKIMRKIKNHHILGIGTKIIGMDKQCFRSYL